MEKTTALVLDFDGTLADTRSLIVSTMRRTAGALGLPPVDEAACVATIGLPLRECFARLYPSADGQQIDQCVTRYRLFFEEGNVPGAVSCFPGVEETLALLHRRGVRLAVCSSRSRQSLLAFLQSMGLSGMVEAVVGAEDTAHAKPHPEPVCHILSAMRLTPEETLVVGDATYDVLMGRAAGCRTCGVTYGNQSAAELRAAGADWLIDNFPELISVIDGREA